MRGIVAPRGCGCIATTAAGHPHAVGTHHQPLRLSVQAVPENVGRLRHAVADYARALGLTDPGAIALAVSEAITNAVVHGYRGRAPGLVTVEAKLARAGFVVVVEDDGDGVKPRPDSPGVGLGLPLLAQLATSFEVEESRSGGTRVRICFAI
jgi:serine/threonine-protein kinase RsbW/stage II sporulation protein AB (anti-sigma F factor)